MEWPVCPCTLFNCLHFRVFVLFSSSSHFISSRVLPFLCFVAFPHRNDYFIKHFKIHCQVCIWCFHLFQDNALSEANVLSVCFVLGSFVWLFHHWISGFLGLAMCKRLNWGELDSFLKAAFSQQKVLISSAAVETSLLFGEHEGFFEPIWDQEHF